MNKNIPYIIIIFFLFSSCKKFAQQSDNWDGNYCAEIKYQNPNTGTKSNYTLTIEVDDNDLTLINYPNGGSLEEFLNSTFNKKGFLEFTSTKGYNYKVQIIGLEKGCFKDLPKPKQCNGTTKKGKQCKKLTDNKSGFCWQHD